MRGISKRIIRGWRLALLLMLAACGSEPESPETRAIEIRAVIAKAQTAAEERNARQLRALIAEDYIDAQGHDRKAIEGLIRLHILRNQSIHVLTQIQTLEFPEPDRALVRVMAALVGRPVASVDELVSLNANLYRFDLEMIRRGEDDWLIRHAAWEQAPLADFW